MATLHHITPGKLLREEFLFPIKFTQRRLAKEIMIPAQQIGQIAAAGSMQKVLRKIKPYLNRSPDRSIA